MKLLRWLDEHFEETLMAALMAMIVIVMGGQVFMRYVVGRSLPWPEEISRYLFVWFAFLGMSFTIKKDCNLRIDLLQVLLPKLTHPLNIFADLVYLGFCILMLGPGLSAIERLMSSNQGSAAMGLPIWIVYLSFYVGLWLSIFRILQKNVLLLVKGFKPAPNREV